MLKSSLAREELNIDKHLIQLIQAYCKAERLEAALDAVLLLSQPATLGAARKIADFFALPALAERIELVRAAKTGEDPDDAASKRQSKYSHLADERTIPEAVSRSTGGGGRSGRGGATSNLFAPGGGDDFFSPRPSGMSSVFGSGRKSSTPVASSSSSKRRKSMPAPSNLGVDSGFGGSDDGDANDSMDVEHDRYAEEDTQEPSPKRFRSDSPLAMDEEAEEEQLIAAPPKKGKASPLFESLISLIDTNDNSHEPIRQTTTSTESRRSSCESVRWQERKQFERSETNRQLLQPSRRYRSSER